MKHLFASLFHGISRLGIEVAVRCVSRGAAGALVIGLASSAIADLDKRIALNPRAEWIRSKTQNQAARGILLGRAGIDAGTWSLSAEGFIEGDLETEHARLRRSTSLAELQEAYFDWRSGPFFVRLGRQPVRWSQSWTLPSLDIFTGRRWNRLFFDPVPEQLIHPDGALVTWVSEGGATTVDVFAALLPAPSEFPEPLPSATQASHKRRVFGRPHDDPEVGTRIQRKFGGLDSSLVYKRADDLNTVGFGLTYATDCCVWKTEAGTVEGQSRFVTLGLDVFVDELSLMPQISRFSDDVLTADRPEHIGYLPIRYTTGPHAFELQLYRNFEVFDTFSHLMYGYDITDELKISAFAQKYEGRAGRLFGAYQTLTENGIVMGLRLELTHAL